MGDPLDHVGHAEAVIVAALATQAFGQDFGYALAWQAAPTPQGILLAWTGLITLRSPLLGQPRLGQVFQGIFQAEPPDEWLAAEVAKSCEALRAQAEAAKHPSSGPLPAGLVAGNGRRS